MTHQPFSRVPEIYGASHLSVVSQAVSTGSDAVPSKVYRIMACGGAVLAATEPQSDLAQLMTAGQCGFIVPQDSPPAIAAVIRQAFHARETLAAMGRSGRQHVLAHYSRPVVTARYDRSFTKSCRSTPIEPSSDPRWGRHAGAQAVAAGPPPMRDLRATVRRLTPALNALRVG